MWRFTPLLRVNITMNNFSRVLGLPLFFALAALLMLSSCASAKKQHPVGYIKKADNYHLKPGLRIDTDDRMIQFEYSHRIHGAIETSDYEARYGHYITVHWRGVEKGADVKLRLEYRQAKTGDELIVLESTPGKIRWRNTSDFEIVGDAYEEGGPITSWRVVLLVNGQEADVFESFLWK